MTVRPDSTSVDPIADWGRVAPRLAQAYIESYRGPQGEAPAIGDSGLTAPIRVRALQVLTPAVLAAHGRLGSVRTPGATNVATYADGDLDSAAPALQVVTDELPMVLEAVTVLLNRLRVPYVSIMNPVFRVRRDPNGHLQDIHVASDNDAGPGVQEDWIHVELAKGVERRSLDELRQQLPVVVTGVQETARDSDAMRSVMRGIADSVDTDTYSRFPAKTRHEVARLLRWLDDGHFVLVGYERCSVGDGDAVVDESSRLGVLRHRREDFPQLTRADQLMAVTQSTLTSYLRYGAHPYVIVVRDESGGDSTEHRLLGLFTVAATNANVMEIPVICSRVDKVLEMSGRDPNSLSGQLLLDVIQTFPRSELFELDVDEMLAMATEIIDVGSRRRTLLYMHPDQLGHFVSALVYLPRDRYTTSVRLEMMAILVRELGGESIDYAARVSESPWAAVHFTVRLPAGARPGAVDTSDDNRLRIQALLTEAARTWGDRLLGAARSDSIPQAVAEHYAEA
ncbi:MAG: glutamate dehydrogenase, partial [Mycobacterium sp.]|nr:glutamate dehydrogenase [Mycobacterium sp.]